MSQENGDEPKPLARRGFLRCLGFAGIGGAAAVVALGLSGVTAAEAQGYPPMPPPRYEHRPPPPPGTRYVWQPGHYTWNGYRYVWHPGRYVPRGPHYGRFVPGHWVNRHGTWVWIPQHWR